SVRFGIYPVPIAGTLLYQETHSVTTDALGLFTLDVGQGIPTSGTFSSITWNSGDKYLQVELDPAGGTSYTDMGRTKMLSVPFALYSAMSASSYWTANGNNINNINSGNVGINTTSPEAKLHIRGSADTSQLIIDANFFQGNSRPLIKLRNSDGTDLLWVHSDRPHNTFVGLNAGRVNNRFGVGGIVNTFIGGNAGYYNTIGYANAATGYSALYFNTNVRGAKRKVQIPVANFQKFEVFTNR